jgi:anion-transporting  ArsA/GET3 family ATPase
VDPASFFAACRVVIVAGKGGVGKTVVSAALARAAASHGLRTLLVEVEGKAASHLQFGTAPLGYAEATLLAAAPAGAVAPVLGRSITPDEALVEYFEHHGMRRMARRLARSGTLEVIATATPGIKDILVLGKVKQLAASDTVDLIIVDAPAAGHAIAFLRAARALLDTARAGPIRKQAHEVLELLTDPQRCHVLLVTAPEETPVNELVETAYALEDQVGVRLGPIIVNGLYDELPGLDAEPARVGPRRAGTALRAAAALRHARTRLQREQVDRLRRELPLEQLHLPFLFTPEVGPAESVRLAGHLVDAVRGLPDHAVGRHG